MFIKENFGRRIDRHIGTARNIGTYARDHELYLHKSIEHY